MGASDNRENIINALYAVFRLTDEQYITTLKLLVIYDWMEPQAGTDSLQQLKALRSSIKRMSNLRKVETIYRMAEHAKLQHNGRYAPSEAKPPMKRQEYISGWLPY